MPLLREASPSPWLSTARDWESASSVHWTGELLPRPCPKYDWDGSTPSKVDGHEEVQGVQEVDMGRWSYRSIFNCQELYFLKDTETPILQTDASDYGIGGYLYMIVNHQVRVLRFFSKSLVGSQLNWSARENECYGIYYGVKLFEDLYHMNLTYINVAFTGKVLRWKMY